ncbi:MAG TPA: DUF547 domain-containing protein [Candidatus Eisenbacteria bacterium]|nr:DUF547 domain-containing protein [Candidatus Eisenbacteria bacterium]
MLVVAVAEPAGASEPYDPFTVARLGADRLLAKIVVRGRVDYEKLTLARAELDSALARAATLDPKLLQDPSHRGPIAFYLNVYNLATLDLVSREQMLRGGRLRSIQEIPGAWSRPRWKVAGVERTLDEIEHEILRKEFREPRIHMALVCASISCPALRPSAYAAPYLDKQLDGASHHFVNDPTRNDFTPREGRIRISKIFDWYGGDFVGVYRDSALERMYGEKEGAVLAFASRYLPPKTIASLRAKKVKIDYLPYDWGLNAAPAARKR